MGPGAAIFLAAVCGLIGLTCIMLARAIAREADKIDLLGDGFDIDDEIQQMLQEDRDYRDK